ncbi:winged helix-turn-helix domain-containing protein [Lysobacter cavernae]|uniref:Winged helix-turn-helix domain-containing protein n=1 Tax=Lysobacter cavernae TaxID=1685901 RepID=A0ABV7RJI8_9GAMM
MPQTRFRFGEYTLDPASRELWRGDARIALPPKSFECLAYLIAHRDRAVGRDELISAVWGRVDTSDTVVAQTLLRARKALDDTGDKQAMVRTVPRFGYRWVAPVAEEVADTPKAGRLPASELPLPPSDTIALPQDDAAPSAQSQAPLPSPPPRRAWVWIALAVLLTVVAAGAGWHAWQSPRESTPTQQDIVLVLPVAVTPVDAESAWVRLGAMDYIASRLRRSGLKVLPSDQTLHLSAQLGSDGAPGEAALRQLQATSGARWVLAPEASRDARGWRLRVLLQEGKQPHLIEARGATPLAAAAAASDSWLRRLGRKSGDPEAAPSPLTERVQQIDAELKTGQLAVARRLIESAPSDQRVDPRLQVRAGQLEYRSGRIDEAARIFQAVLEETTQPGAEVRARALMGLGAVEIRRRNFAEAEKRYTGALAVIEANPAALDDPSLPGNAYNGRGVAQVEQQKMEAAVRDMGHARIAMQRAGDLVEAAMVDSNLGIIETRRGHYPQALQEFDRAIAVYERFDVRDYLAATLSSKAATQLKLAQPAAALATIERAQAQAEAAEDADLGLAVGVVQVQALLANGRLRAAAQGLDRLKALGLDDSHPALRELTLRLRLTQGATAQAGALARQYPETDTNVRGSWALAAVQAALRNNDEASARHWLSRAPQSGSPGADDAVSPWDVARALVANSAGDSAAAMQSVQRAANRAEQDGNPDERVRAGVVQAMLLLEQGQSEAAASVLGDLDTFAGSDYRVAWAMLALYRALGDPTMTAEAESRAQALRGERDPSLKPVL